MNAQKTEIELLTEIRTQLDQVIGMMAIAGKDQDEQIRILRDLGHDWPTVGKLVGIKPDAARMQASRALKKNGVKPR